MRVVKRDGTVEAVSFDKVLRRIELLCKNLDGVDPHSVAQKVCSRIYDGVKTSELDELAAQMCSSMISDHPDYGVLAARIIVSNHQKNTSPSFSETVSSLYHAKDVHGKASPLVTQELYDIVQAHKEKLNSIMDYDRDFLFDYFGFKTLERAYLMRVDGKVVERPQHMWMRVALGIHGWDIKDAIETYELMSLKKFTHATPTLFNAGTNSHQLASCFTANTDVFTVNRGMIKIQDVKVGDEVVTHKGTVEKVMQVHQNLLNDRTLYNVKCAMTPEFNVTDNHRMWSITQEQKGWKFDPQWNSIKDLRVGDWIAIPNKQGGLEEDTWDVYAIMKDTTSANHHEYTYHLREDKISMTVSWEQTGPQYNGAIFKNHRDGGYIHRYWKVDEELAWFLGVWFGDGCVTHRNRTMPCNIQIVSSKENTALIEKIARIGEEKFGKAPTISYMKGQNLVQIVWSNNLLANAFKNLFNSGFAGKRLNTNMFSWSKKLVNAFMGGLISADGCVTNNANISITLSNEMLMKEIYHWFRSVGFVVGLNKVKKTEDYKYAQPWTMAVPCTTEVIPWILKFYKDDRLTQLKESTHKSGKSMMYKGQLFVRIERKVPMDDTPDYVYTLGIEHSHSYSVEGLIAENCFLLGTHDSVIGMYKNISDCAQISKYAGGIGVHIHNIRARGSHIRGTNGTSSGIIPMLRVYNGTARHINQAGKRLGSIAIYLEPWHADVEAFLDIRKNHGSEEDRCRDLFTALWIPDLFMKRVADNGDWSLMCPDECPGLHDVYGEEFESLYLSYEAQGRYRKQVKAQSIWMAIIKSQIETGTPYLLYKDHVNRKTNQKNVGVIKSSNLCAEICEYSDEKEYATCNLASIALPSFIKEGVYDFESLRKTVHVITKNINKVIDRTLYPVIETERSNKRHRPIGIGVQGLADTYALMRVAFDSVEAASLNSQIFETIYYGAMEASMELSKKRADLRAELMNVATTDERKQELRKHLQLTEEEEALTSHLGAYSTFKGSPASQGIFQFDLWEQTPYGRWDWAKLKEDVKTYGVRNSLLLAPMPTASTSQILGFNECIEPITSNIYQRRTLAGEFTIINKYLIQDLLGMGLWNMDMKNRILLGNGSIQNIQEIPEDIRALYKTAWELKQKVLIDQAADRGIYVCQSQSLNLFVEDPEFSKLTNMHFYAWRKGLKTGIYYLRTRPKAKAMAFSIDATTTMNHAANIANNEQECTMCSA